MPLFAHSTTRWLRQPSGRRYALFLFPVLLLGAGWARGAEDHAAKPDAAAYEKQVRPVLQQFCVGCHGAQKPAGGVNLAAFPDAASAQHDPAMWRKILAQLRARTMPPVGMPKPTDAQRAHVMDWITQTLDGGDAPKNPGRVLIHRLSRTEYNNTLHDLLGVTSNPADKFPADGGGGGGFDNDANTLYIPPILMERYLEAASQALDEAKPDRIFVVRAGRGLPKRSVAKKNIERFATHAFRRPLEATESDRLMRLYDLAIQRGQSFENAVKLAYKAVLVSPNFLFRIEKDRNSAQPYPLNDFELASRLSYFLWSSMPDDELLALAGQQRLRKSGVLDAQIRRMLQSPKSHALAESFGGQWLRVRDLYTSRQPDPDRFPNYTPTLRDAMYREPIEFFASVLHENASLLDLLDADYTYVNEELAKFYGIEGVKGVQMRRVPLSDRNRGGVLTMASVLTITSYPQRTSPVLRGKWVLGEVLGAPPAPPPPNAGGLPADDAPTKEGLTFRQRLEKHREKPECAGCHNRMDPIGFGLENFDGIGRWRTEIGGKPVDSSGVLATGEKFSGPVELKKCLMAQRDEFLRNLTEKMLAYALGRGLESYDAPAVRKITSAVEKDGYHSVTLIREIVKSYPFQYRSDTDPTTKLAANGHK